MSLFTPITGTLGGSLIGLSAGTLLLGNGDILGCSGIVSSIFIQSRETFRGSKSSWKVAFVASFLISSRLIMSSLHDNAAGITEYSSYASAQALPIVSDIGFAVAGFLVGFGTRLGNGCTTGHGICGMARLSKRSLLAVASFMATGIAAATVCSPFCKLAKYLRTSVDHLDDFYPTEKSTTIAASTIGIIVAMALFKIFSPKSGNSNDDDKDEAKKQMLKNDQRKIPVAFASAAIFSAGLFISGMTKTYKIYGFLDMKKIASGTWDPTLMFVMGSGLLVSAISYHFVKGHNLLKNEKAMTCPLTQSGPDGNFNVPTNTKIDKQLVIGASIFGLGWGIAGLCPGPALFLAANGYPQVLYFWWPSNILGAILGEKAKKFL